jgi:DNA-binding PucR family transcriptional regulator
MIPDERTFQLIETARASSNIYYRVVADGVDLDSLICISINQRSRTLEYELMMWCKFNVRRLTSGRVVRADLDSVRDSSPETDESRQSRLNSRA